MNVPYLSSIKKINRLIIKGMSNISLKPQGKGFENLQSNDKSNLLRKVDFLLKSGFQVIAFCILWR